MAWPTHYRWDANAAFEQLELHASERPDIREPLPAIVTCEDYDCVCCQLVNVQRSQHSPNIGIQAPHHFCVCRLGTAVASPDAPDVPKSLRFGLVVRPLPGPMRRREMQAQQKRLLRPGVSLDRLNCPIAEQVRHVAVPLDRHLFLMELVCQFTTA